MKFFRQYLLGFVGGAFLTIASVGAQEGKQNSIESMTVASQGGVVKRKADFQRAACHRPIRL